MKAIGHNGFSTLFQRRLDPTCRPYEIADIDQASTLESRESIELLVQYCSFTSKTRRPKLPFLEQSVPFYMEW